MSRFIDLTGQTFGRLTVLERAENAKTHGLRHSRIYKTWCKIKERCYNPKCKNYSNYGGRGIKICAEWKDDFLAFYNYVSKLEHFGEKMTLAEAAEISGLPYYVLENRYRRGDRNERLFRPVRK